MVRAEEVRAALERLDRVRNVSVIAHVDHGKTTLTDQLLARSGLLYDKHAGNKRATDTRADEQLRGITIKSTAVSLLYKLSDAELQLLPKVPQPQPQPQQPPQQDEGEDRDLVVNLIDSPGHVDFSSEVTAALRLTDGAMVVVDCVSGVCVQTETVLRQAISQRIRPVLMMNKLDRCILEKQMEHEDLYRHLRKVISNVNVIIETYHDETSGVPVTKLDPVVGNVAIGCGLHGWAFTLRQMAEVYARRLGIDAARMRQRLWGDHFYNAATRKWRRSPAEGYERAFNKFVLAPLYQVLRKTLTDTSSEELGLDELLARIDVTLPAEEKATVGKERMRSVMRRWLPAGDAMLQMIVEHLPSPRVAQAYTAELLYEGPMDDDAAVGIKSCDPAGPLMVYISKMVPAADGNHVLAFGRVFSGTVRRGQKVRVLGPNYNPNSPNKGDVTEATIGRTVVMMGATTLSVDDVPCGSVVGLSGLDKSLRKTGTLTSSAQAHNLRVMRFSVSPVVRMAIEARKPADVIKLVEGVRRLSKLDPLIEVEVEESGQMVVAAAGELHLEVALSDLEELAKVEFKRDQPIVSFRETVTEMSSMQCLTKTTNKLNRLWLRAQPLPDDLCQEIDEGQVKPTDDVKQRARHLADTYNIDVAEGRRLWCFGPDQSGPNLLFDVTKGVQHLGDIRDAVVAGFGWATKEGPLAEERMRGVRFDILDATVHSNTECRRAAQVIPASRRGFLGAALTARPALLEPVFLVEIQCTEGSIGGVHQTISPRRGHIFDEMHIEGTPLYQLKAYVPVCESFGLTESLRGNTGGQAFPQCVFDHWKVMPGDPRDPSSKAGTVISEIRRRKGLRDLIPGHDFYLSKM